LLRRLGVAVGLAFLASIALAPHWAAADDGGVAANAQGWWDVLTSLPQTPLGANVPSLGAPTADVPEGVIPVTMRLGQPARVAAIGITMTATPGATVNKLIMTLKASDASGAQQGTGGSVKACPITSFLVPEENGKAADAPEADCSLAEAVGEAGDDGTWTFDLTKIAQVWLDPFQGVPIQGLRLDPVGDAPATFQVGFTGYQDATFDADIVAGAGAGGDDAFTSGDLGGGSAGSFSGGDFSAPTATLPPAPRGEAEGQTAAPRQRVAPVAASRAGDTLGNFPLSILPATLGTILIAILASLSLGAGARGREAAVRRQGGVSRVLSHRLTDRREPRG